MIMTTNFNNHPPIIKVKDSIEGWKEAMEQLSEALKSGGGIGIDIRDIQSKEKQETFIAMANELVNQTYVAPRKSSAVMNIDELFLGNHHSGYKRRIRG